MAARLLALVIAGALVALGSARADAKGVVSPVLDVATGSGFVWAPTGFNLARIDPRTSRVVGRARLGRAYPIAVAHHEGAVWVLGTYISLRRRFAALWRVDPASGRRVGPAIGMDAEPVGLVAGAGAVWVLDRARGRLLGFSVRSRRLVHESYVGRAPMALAVGAGAVWVTRAGLRERTVRRGSVSCTLVRVDPRSGSVRERAVPKGCARDGLAVAAGAVWIAGGRRLTRVDRSGTRRRTHRLGSEIVALAGGSSRVALLSADGRIMVTRGGRPSVLAGRLPPAGRPRLPISLALGAGALWVGNAPDGSVSRLDPVTGRTLARVRVARAPGGPLATAGLKLVLPVGWSPVPVYQPVQITDPLTRLVAGSHPVALRASSCQLGLYRVPSRGAVVIILEWRGDAGGPTTPRPSRLGLRELHVRRGAIGCQPVRGGATGFTDNGRRLGVYLLLGDRASARTVREALGVVRSLSARPRQGSPRP